MNSQDKKSTNIEVADNIRAIQDAEVRRRRIETLPFEPSVIDTTKLAKAPMEMLPKVIRNLVSELAASFMVPEEMVLPFALGTLSGAIGARRNLEIQTGWRESAILWLAVVARPGSGKSPLLNQVMAPLRAWEKEKELHYEAAVSAFNALNKDPNVKKSLDDFPVRERSIVSDVTIEKLALILEENRQGLLLAKDELGSFASAMGQYKGGAGGADRSNYLSLWSAQPITIDRKRENQHTYVEYPCLSVVGGIQPDMIAQMKNGNGDDGFLDRILFVSIDPNSIKRRFHRPAVSLATKNAWAELVRGILELPMKDEPATMYLSKSAHVEYERLYDSYAKATEAEHFPYRLYGVWGKMESYAARLALVIHLARLVSGETTKQEVDVKSVQSAWALVKFFLIHANAVRGITEQSATDRKVAAVYNWFKRRTAGSATLRDVVRSGVGGVKGRADALALVEELQGRNFLEQLPDGSYKLLPALSGLSD